MMKKNQKKLRMLKKIHYETNMFKAIKKQQKIDKKQEQIDQKFLLKFPLNMY